MQRDEVGALQQLLQRYFFYAEVNGSLSGEKRVEGDHLHLHAERAIGNDRANIAAANDSQRLAEDLDAEKLVFLPFSGAGRGVGFGNLPRQREHQGDGVFGRCNRIAEWRVHHNDAAGRCCRDIDIVDANPCAPDDFQVARLARVIWP